jgi:hypothetical protein
MVESDKGQPIALPHEKCYRKGVMPQIENVTQMAQVVVLQEITQ